MSSLQEAKEEIIRNVVEAVVGVIVQKTFIEVDKIQFDGNVLEYTGDVGILISVLITLHDIFELDFKLDLNKVEEKFTTVESLVEYFLDRIVDEKILKEK